MQFRVSSGDSYQFTNESDAMIFQSYEFELWDLQNDTEYEIPSGEYVSVTVPVKSGYEYTIEHLLDNGATETIIPSVEDGIMVFSTHSFSPFGIAGSRQLVGPDTGDDSNSAGTVTPTPAHLIRRNSLLIQVTIIQCQLILILTIIILLHYPHRQTVLREMKLLRIIMR